MAVLFWSFKIMYRTFHIINSAHPCTELVMDINLIRNYLAGAGLRETSALKADLLLISTCAYNLHYEQDCVNNFEKAIKIIEEGSNPHKSSGEIKKKIIVVGCLPKINPELYKKYNFTAINPGELDDIEKIVKSSQAFNEVTAPLITIEEYKNNPLFMKGIKLKTLFKKISHCLSFIKTPSWLDTVPMTDWYFIRTATGCTGNCTFCAVKRARGHIKSTPFRVIEKHVKLAIESGYKEISLTGDDMGCYGVDTGSSLAEILTRILAVDKNFSVNIRFVEPLWLIKGLADLYPVFKTGRIKSFCVPLQSGSQSVLDRMNRHYNIDQAVNAINYVLDKTAVNSISSIVMVGFPGETDDDFIKTCGLLAKCRANLYQVLKYEERPDTPSAKMDNKISEEIKDKRSAYFTKKMKIMKFAGLSEKFCDMILKIN